jgi:RNA polymerase sigma-70 factor (ECF subfamily)
MIDNKYLEDIYEQYNNIVFNLCLNYVLQVEEAQDITQEVFVKVYHRFQQYNPEKATIKTWICQIAINQCLDFLKSKKTSGRFGFLTSLFYQDTNEPIETAINIHHPGIAAEDKDGLEKLLKIIYTLPDNQKTAIILTKVEGRPQHEVAEIMNISIKAVESLLQRAKQNIAKKLTDTEGL